MSNFNENFNNFTKSGVTFSKQYSAMYKKSPLNKYYQKEQSNYTNNRNIHYTNNRNWSGDYNMPTAIPSVSQIQSRQPACISLGGIPF